ncbi:unnamed protein product [Closterium sp. NIES-53]
MRHHAHCAGANSTTCRRLHLRSPVDHVPPNRRSTLPIYLGDIRKSRRPRRSGNLVELRLVDLGGRPVEGVDLGDADQGKPTGCGRLTGVLVELELVDQLQVDSPLGRPTPVRPVHLSADHIQSASPGRRHPSQRPPLVDLPSQPAEVGVLPKSAPLQWPLCRLTRPIDQLTHCCRSAALLTPDREVGSAQARTGPTTTPVDTPLLRSRLAPPAQTTALLGE